jgi:3-keto-5-aminohexanoate cleavage enzyme
MGNKIVITCALTGVLATRKQCPAIPYTPVEIAEEAKRAYDAGASVVHIHARNDDGTPSYEVDTYRRIKEEIEKRCPILLNFSTGAVGISREQKAAPFRELRPHIAALNMGSMNYAKYSKNKKRFEFDVIFENPFSEIQYLLEGMNEAAVKPELECFDFGHAASADVFHEMGLLPRFQYSLIMGVLGGVPPTPENLMQMVRNLPKGAQWEIIGISHPQWRLVATALVLGGNIRVGLEDNLYLHEGVMARSNGELVEKAARMTRDIGLEPANVDEAKKILSIP